MSKEKDTLLGHSADNDGIDEYDNALPDWWLGLFAFTIVWGVGYGLDYHFLRPTSQAARYDSEMAAARVQWPQATAKALVFDEASLTAGAELFKATCVSCHGAELGGAIGPSLVDATWIHGGEPEQIRATITNGVAAKGMPSWGPILGPDKVAKLTAFVVSKAKEGPGAASPAPVAAATAAPVSGDPGEVVFRENCVVCHGENLEGKIGPNLVDGEWIHGGQLADIERTITVGVPEKGMVSWGPILGEEKIKHVATYVHRKGSAPQ